MIVKLDQMAILEAPFKTNDLTDFKCLYKGDNYQIEQMGTMTDNDC